MAFEWLKSLWPSKEPEPPTPLQLYNRHRADQPNDDSAALTQLLLNVWDRYGMDIDVDFRVRTFLTSRYTNVDDLVYAFRSSNAHMAERDKIEYGAIRSASHTVDLDTFLLTNEGFVVDPEMALTALRQCFNLYEAQQAAFDKETGTVHGSYYRRVYGLYITELNGLLKSLLLLT